MGQVQSVFDPDNERANNSPTGYQTPPFPSLYNPTLQSTVEQRGYFLHSAYAIWEFTFYWTLILLGVTFLVCAVLASANLLLSRTVFGPSPARGPGVEAGYHGAVPVAGATSGSRVPSATYTQRSVPSTRSSGVPLAGGKPVLSRYHQRRRPPLWTVMLIPVCMLIVAAFVALVSGTVVGFALAAVYAAAGFSMSTWVPFLWAMIQVIVLIIASYSSLTRVL